MHDFLVNELAVDGSNLSSDAALFSSGLIDSFALVTLLTFVETESGLMISPEDVNLENFDSIDRILDFVARSQT